MSERAFYAFISYKHKDNAPWAANDEYWAQTIYQLLSTWRIPTAISDDLRISKADKYIKPIFRDKWEKSGGDETTTILHRNLDLSRNLILICSRAMIKDQREKRKLALRKNSNEKDKAYIFDEVDYFLAKKGKGKVILVWIDDEPFDKNDPLCMPPQFFGTDLMAIQVREFKKTLWGDRKRQVTAEVAASIFQSSRGLFWDFFKRRRRERIVVGSCLLMLFVGIFFFLWRENNIHLAYRLTLEAQELLNDGNRLGAMHNLVNAYECYPNADGLSTAMWRSLDASQPLMNVDGYVEVCEATQQCAVIEDKKEVVIYDLATLHEVQRISIDYVERVKFSPDGRILALIALKSTQLFDLSTSASESTNHPDSSCVYCSKGITLPVGIDNYPHFRFGDTNRQLLCHDDEGRYHIYDTQRGDKLFESILYSDEMDSWTRADFRYINGDSLLAVYGKRAPVVRGAYGSWDGYQQNEAKWACHIFNTHHVHPNRKCQPLQIDSLAIAQNINCMEADEYGRHLLMATPNELIIHYLYPQAYYRSISRPYTLRFLNWGKEQIAAFHQYYPQAGNCFKEIHFSPDGSRALLVADDFRRISLHITPGNIFPDEYCCLNHHTFNFDIISSIDLDTQRSQAIAIDNEQRVVFLNPNEMQEANLSITPLKLQYGLCQYSHWKPVTQSLLRYTAYLNKHVMIVTETNQNVTSRHISNETKKYVRSYLYQHRKMINTPNLDKLHQNQKWKIGGVSPGGRYVMVSKEIDHFKDQIYLWDLEKDTICHDLTAMVDSSIGLYCSNPVYLTEDESLIGMNCWMRQDKGWTSSNIIIDVRAGRTAFERKGSNSSALYDISRTIDKQNGNGRIMLLGMPNETLFFDLNKRDTILRDNLSYTLLNHKGPNIIMVTSIPKEGRALFTYRVADNKLHRFSGFDVGDYSYRLLTASSNGRFLAMEKGNHLIIVELETGRFLYELPLGETIRSFYSYTPYVCFVKDNRYLLYAKESNTGLTLFDLQTGKEVYSLPGSHQIKENRTSNSVFLLMQEQTPFCGIAVSEQWLAIQSHQLKLFDLTLGEEYVSFDLPLHTYAPMTFSPNGDYLVVDNYLIDVKGKQCISQGIKPYSIRSFTDKNIVYDDSYIPIVKADGLYQFIKEFLISIK